MSFLGQSLSDSSTNRNPHLRHLRHNEMYLLPTVHRERAKCPAQGFQELESEGLATVPACSVLGVSPYSLLAKAQSYQVFSISHSPVTSVP